MFVSKTPHIQKLRGEALPIKEGSLDQWESEDKSAYGSLRNTIFCDNYDSRFETHSSFAKHEKIYTEEPQLICEICSRIFLCKKKLDLHLIGHHKWKPYSCNKCERQFSKSYGLKRHLLMHDKSKPLPGHNPPNFSENCQDQPDNNRRSERHKIQKLYPCPVCDKRFTLKTVMKEHCLSHSNVDSDSDDETKEKTADTFNTEEELLNDKSNEKITTHPTVLYLTISEESQNNSNNEMSDPLPDKTPINILSVYQCHLCYKKLTTKKSMKRHIEAHSKVKKYSCPECHDKFVYRYDLRKHIVRFHRDKPFRCKSCNKEFGLKIDCYKHYARVHSSKPYHCDECDRSYGLKCDLERHILTHADKHHTCLHCAKRFQLKEELDQHVTCVHLNELHLCEVCDKSFGNETALRNHKLCRHFNKPYSCFKCENQFSMKKDLARHLNHVHSIELKPEIRRFLNIESM